MPVLTVSSMTGFARIETEQPWGSLSCEIRSVNHRYLESSLRMPEALRAAESDFRELIKQHLSRGKVDVSLFMTQEQGAESTLDELALKNIANLLALAEKSLPNAAPVNYMEVLRWPGILKHQEVDSETLIEASKTLLAEALVQLKQNRLREGKSLASSIVERLLTIGEHVQQLKAEMPVLVVAQQEKLRKKIDALQVDVDEDRLAQELVIIAQKADVAEELDRLETHIQETQHTLHKNEPIGRRLDFLMQEFNREANTLSSKAIASGVTQVAVELKVLIEQMREQIQNVE